MKKLFFQTIIVLVIFFTAFAAVYAESEKKSDKSSVGFHWSLGTKFVYSSGISDAYTYNRSNVTGELRSDYLDVSTFIRRYFHYQLTDGNGVYEYRSFNEAGLSLTAHLLEIINLKGEYNRADDFDNLKRNIYIGSIELELSKVMISADYSYEKFKYYVNYTGISTTKRDYSLDFEYNISDTFSTDLGYTHNNIYFDTLEYSYYKNIIRGGITHILSNRFYLIAGASLGKDSIDYNIYGANCALTIKPYSHIKFSFAYNIYYFSAPVVDSTKGSAGTGNGNKTNPYLTSDKAGESYYSHVVSAGMSAYF